MPTKKIVITGGPCSGKSAVKWELQLRGYYVVYEAALAIIGSQKYEKGNIFPTTHPEEFQREVYWLQILWEDEIPKNVKIAYLDRCIYDSIAYLKSKNLPVSKEWEEEMKKRHYDIILFLEMLPKEYWVKTETGKPRFKTYEEGAEDTRNIKEFYERLSHTLDIELIHIPVIIPVKKRVDFIEECLESIAPSGI